MSIKFHDVFYTYLPNTPYQFEALKGVNLEIKAGEFIAIIGPTGSGKSTLVQHINGLLAPMKGEVEINGFKIKSDTKTKNLKQLRKKAGLVFQFPEYQLFEESVYKDIAFGPKNFGESEAVIAKRIAEIAGLLNLDKSLMARSPFELSGGQKRRVAIAGILALDPEILILDEPTAGLDPRSAEETMALYENLNILGKTIILVTHDMDDVLKYCDRAAILSDGKVVAVDTPINIFTNEALVKESQLDTPLLLKVAQALKKGGLVINFDELKDIKDLVSKITAAKGKVSKK
jgi:energy-coupling factor transport system ATP-binding protein